MPVSRKSKSMPDTSTPFTRVDSIRDRLPRRIVLFIVVSDESGSMGRWRQRQGEFIPAVAAHLTEVGGPKIGELVYLLHCVVSGGVVTTAFTPLDKASDPTFIPDGFTPIGEALSVVAQECEEFLSAKVFPQEVTVRNFQILIVSDLRPSGESIDETEAGVAAFVAMAKKYKAKVNLVGPAPEVMNQELAVRLDTSGQGVKYLDSDPKAVVNITFDSLLSASRMAIGGSNPSIRNG